MKVIAIDPGVQSAYANALRVPGFRMLWFGQVCSQFAFSTLIFVLGLRVYQSTNSNAAVSILFLFQSLPAIFFGLIAGTLVDRLDKRRVLIFCDILRGCFALGLLFNSHQMVFVYILTFLNSIVTQLYVPAEAPLIPKLVPKPLLVTANSMFSFTFYSSLAIGSVLAGPLLRWFGTQGIFFLIASLFFLASLFSSRISGQSKNTVGIRYLTHLALGYLISRVWQRLKDGVGYVMETRSLFDSIILLTGTQIIFAFLGSLGPGFADEVLHVDVRDASLLLIGPTVLGILCGAVWIGSKGYKYSSRRLIQIGVLSTGFLLMMIALGTQIANVSFWSINSFNMVAVVVFLLFLLGISNSLLDVPANAMIQQEAKGAMRGRVYGILGAFVGGIGLLPVITGGFLADAIGVEKVIFILGLLITTYGFGRLRYNKK